MQLRTNYESFQHLKTKKPFTCIMATIKKIPSGKWQVQIARKGIRKSASFATRREASDWAARQEYLVLEKPPPKQTETAFGEVLERYARTVSPTKRGARWEILRIGRLIGDRIAQLAIENLQPADLADWRDRRLGEVSPASVNREMVLLSGVLSVARREWGLIDHNPMSDIRKPSVPPPRDRRISDHEIARLVDVAGSDLTKATSRAIHAFRFAVETGMRAGEIISLVPDAVNCRSRVATLPMTKNGTGRKVPLSSAAVALLEQLPVTPGPLFQLTSAQLDALFRKVRDKAAIDNLRFHDSRHEAVTRLARKMDVLSLARVVGHKDIRMLMVYYNETAEELADRLD